MKVDVKNEKNNKITLTIEVGPEKIREIYKKELAKVSQKIKLKGFREGKAPLKIVENAVGKDALYKEVLEALIPETYSEAVYDKEITPIAMPEFKEVNKIEEGKPFTYKLLVEVKPAIDLENYLGLEIEQEKREILDKDIDKQLETMQKQLGKLAPVEEVRPLQIGDYASCDYEMSVEVAGEKTQKDKPRSAKEALIKVEERKEIPGFAENIVGLNPGEEKEFHIDLKHGDASQKTNVKFKLHEIKKEVLPELNDDFAKTISGYFSKNNPDFKAETIQELKDKIKDGLLKAEEEKVKSELENKILDKILENNKIEAAPNMINYEMNILLNDFETKLHKNGMHLDAYLKAINKGQEEFEGELKPQAEKMAKIELALDSIAEKEKIQVTEEDLDKELEETALELHEDREKLKEKLVKNRTLNNFKYGLLRKKVVDYLISKTNVKYKEITNDKTQMSNES